MGGLFDSIETTHDQLKGGAPVNVRPMHGLYKAEVTGDFMKGDSQYISVVVEGAHCFARPCYGFGARVAAPTKDFLEKYKTQIFFWVMFEKSEPGKCVWLGWNWLKEKQTGIDDFPDAAYFRTIYFTEELNDKTKEYVVKWDDKGYYVKYNSKGWFAKVKEGLFEIAETLNLKSKKQIITSDKIYIGSDKAKEAMVLGNTLNDNLKQFITLTQQHVTASTAIATAAAGGVTNGGSAAALSGQVPVLLQLSAQLSALSGILIKQLSNKTTVE